MASRKEEKIEIVSISYKVNGIKHIMKPPKKKSGTGRSLTGGSAEEESCTPGATRCVNHILQRCFDIGEGQCVWMESSETC